MKLWKGNVFTSVCQEFCPQGGCLPDTPPGQTPPPDTPLQADTPLGRHPTRQTPPPQADTPLPQQTATAADGTHPTGMHSC